LCWLRRCPLCYDHDPHEQLLQVGELTAVTQQCASLVRDNSKGGDFLLTQSPAAHIATSKGDPSEAGRECLQRNTDDSGPLYAEQICEFGPNDLPVFCAVRALPPRFGGTTAIGGPYTFTEAEAACRRQGLFLASMDDLLEWTEAAPQGAADLFRTSRSLRFWSRDSSSSYQRPGRGWTMTGSSADGTPQTVTGPTALNPFSDRAYAFCVDYSKGYLANRKALFGEHLDEVRSGMQHFSLCGQMVGATGQDAAVKRTGNPAAPVPKNDLIDPPYDVASLSFLCRRAELDEVKKLRADLAQDPEKGLSALHFPVPPTRDPEALKKLADQASDALGVRMDRLETAILRRTETPQFARAEAREVDKTDLKKMATGIRVFLAVGSALTDSLSVLQDRVPKNDAAIAGIQKRIDQVAAKLNDQFQAQKSLESSIRYSNTHGPQAISLGGEPRQEYETDEQFAERMAQTERFRLWKSLYPQYVKGDNAPGVNPSEALFKPFSSGAFARGLRERAERGGYQNRPASYSGDDYDPEIPDYNLIDGE
jgi:hypothetical protein